MICSKLHKGSDFWNVFQIRRGVAEENTPQDKTIENEILRGNPNASFFAGHIVLQPDSWRT